MPDTPQIGYKPAVVDFVVQQGDPWEQKFILYSTYIGAGDPGNVRFDATGYNVRMQVRNRPMAVMDGVQLIADLKDDIAGGNNKIVWIDRVQGEFRAALTKTDTAAMPVITEKISPTFPIEARYFYDIELFNNAGFDRKIFRGNWKLVGEITVG